MGLSLSVFSLVSCGNRAYDTNLNIGNDEIERLPEDQKESELDKLLVEMRNFRKKNLKVENGSMSSISKVDTTLPGQTKNRPSFEGEELEEIYNVVYEYLADKFKIDLKDSEKIDKFNCEQSIDPRVNAIYDDKDKGVAEGYENENIYVAEYEEKQGTYKFLILVRNSETGSWKLIHDGDGYKK